MAVAGGAIVVSGIAAIPAAPTVIGEVAVWGAFAGSCAAYIAAALALADCLDDAGKHQDAESLRREMDQLKEQIRKLEEKVSH